MSILHIFSNEVPDLASGWNDFGVIITGQPSTFKGRPSTAFNIPDIVGQANGFTVELVKFGEKYTRRQKFKGILHLKRDGYKYPWAVPEQTAALEQDDCWFEDELSFPEPQPCPEPNPEPIPNPGDPQSELEVVIRAYEVYPDFEQRVDLLKKIARDLNFYGFKSPNNEPFGILRKETGHNCGGYSCDIIAAGNDAIQLQWDIMTDDGPIWGGPKGIADGIRIDVCEPQL